MDGFALVVLLVAVAAVVFLKFLARTRTAPSGQLQYRRRPALFTAAERSFAGVLDQILDGPYRIYGKVRVADLIEPMPGKDRRIWQKSFNRISAKHFDFVICNSSDLVPVVVIELDDSSHQKNKRQQRDEMLQQICEQVQLPLIRVPARKAYKLADVEVYLQPLRDLESTVDSESTGQGAPLRAMRDIVTGWRGYESLCPCLLMIGCVLCRSIDGLAVRAALSRVSRTVRRRGGQKESSDLFSTALGKYTANYQSYW